MGNEIEKKQSNNSIYWFDDDTFSSVAEPISVKLIFFGLVTPKNAFASKRLVFYEILPGKKHIKQIMSLINPSFHSFQSLNKTKIWQSKTTQHTFISLYMLIKRYMQTSQRHHHKMVVFSHVTFLSLWICLASFRAKLMKKRVFFVTGYGNILFLERRTRKIWHVLAQTDVLTGKMVFLLSFVTVSRKYYLCSTTWIIMIWSVLYSDRKIKIQLKYAVLVHFIWNLDEKHVAVDPCGCLSVL